jgi:hypothetical protein
MQLRRFFACRCSMTSNLLRNVLASPASRVLSEWKEPQPMPRRAPRMVRVTFNVWESKLVEVLLSGSLVQEKSVE